MRLQRLQKILVPIRRYAITLPTMAGYLIVALGIPCPAARPAKDTKVPYPCQTRSCGCSSAEQFWHSCCCMTMSERLAWARDHNVSPPPDVEQSAPEPEDQPSCCSSSPCCESTQPSCCKKAPTKNKQAAPAKPEKTPTGWFARQCGGTANYWLNPSPVCPPDGWLTWNYEWTPLEWVPQTRLTSQQLSRPLDTPPPRG